MRRAQPRLVPIHQALLDELRERLLEGERSRLAGDRNLLTQVLQRILPNVLARPVTDQKQFRSRQLR